MKFKRGYWNTKPTLDPGNMSYRVDTVYASRRLPASDDQRERYFVGSVCDRAEDGFVTRGPLRVPYSALGVFVSTGPAPKRVR